MPWLSLAEEHFTTLGKKKVVGTQFLETPRGVPTPMFQPLKARPALGRESGREAIWGCYSYSTHLPFSSVSLKHHLANMFTSRLRGCNLVVVIGTSTLCLLLQVTRSHHASSLFHAVMPCDSEVILKSNCLNGTILCLIFKFSAWKMIFKFQPPLFLIVWEPLRVNPALLYAQKSDDLGEGCPTEFRSAPRWGKESRRKTPYCHPHFVGHPDRLLLLVG